MAAARATEYAAVAASAAAVAADSSGGQASTTAAVRRLRNELRQIQRRDYFPPAERDHAEAAIKSLAAQCGEFAAHALEHTDQAATE
jgi:hypothetical protein